MKKIFGLKKKFEAFKEEREEKKKTKKRAKDAENEITGEDTESKAEETPREQSLQNSQEANRRSLTSGEEKGILSFSTSFRMQPAPESPSKADLPQPLTSLRYVPPSTFHSVEGVGVLGGTPARPSTASVSPLVISENSGFERVSSSGFPPSSGHPKKKVMPPVKMVAIPPPLSARKVDDHSLIILENSRIPSTPSSGGKKLIAKKMMLPSSSQISMNSSIDGQMGGKLHVPSGGVSPSLTKVVLPPTMMPFPGPRKSAISALPKKLVMVPSPNFSGPNLPKQVILPKKIIHPPKQLSVSSKDIEFEVMKEDPPQQSYNDATASLHFEEEETPLLLTTKPSARVEKRRDSSISFASTASSGIHISEVKPSSMPPPPLRSSSFAMEIGSSPPLSPGIAAASPHRKPSFHHPTPHREASTPAECPINEEKQVSNSFQEVLPLTKELRRKIIGNLSTVLSPHQYYGRILKIVSIQPLKVRKPKFSLDKSKSEPNSAFVQSIYVGTKDLEAPYCFYPQLRLFDTDGVQSPNGKSGEMETAITIHEARPEKMMFVNSDLEAAQLLESSICNSCYIASSMSIKFKDPESFVVPLAKLKIRWVSFSSPLSEPLCPVHHKEMQLFDPSSRRLVCALCASKHPTSLSKLVVIPDFLNIQSKNRILDSLSQQQQNAKRNLISLLAQHHAITRMAGSKKKAILQQFSMLLDAIETQKTEYLAACENEFEGVLRELGREVVTTSEKVEVLSAANYHLSNKSTLFALQITTVAEGLEADKLFPTNYSLCKEGGEGLKIPALWSGIMPRLEKVMTAVQELNPYSGLSLQKSLQRGENGISFRRSHRRKDEQKEEQQIAEDENRLLLDDVRNIYPSPVERSPSVSKRLLEFTRTSSPHKITVVPATKEFSSLYERRKTTRNLSPRLHDTVSNSNSPNAAKRKVQNSPPPVLTDIDKVQQSVRTAFYSGTLMFAYPLHEMLIDAFSDSDSSPAGRRTNRKEAVIEWSIRIDDYGNWVGIGVGVGTRMELIGTPNSTSDLAHLWLPPYGTGGETYFVRVTAQRNGRAKLSVHGRRGKVLDDWSVPQWHSERPCYPQVTFGGKVGHAELVQVPCIIN